MVLGKSVPSGIPPVQLSESYLKQGIVRNSNPACVSVPLAGRVSRVGVLTIAIISISAVHAHTLTHFSHPLLVQTSRVPRVPMNSCPCPSSGPLINAHQSGSRVRVTPPMSFLWEDPIVLVQFVLHLTPRQGFKQNCLTGNITPEVEDQAGKRRK